MNLKNLGKVAGIVFLVFLFSCFGSKAQGITPPPDPDFLLDSWGFDDTNWLSALGDAPVSFTNLNNPPSFDGNALQMDSTNQAFLQYNIVDDVATNLTFREGTIELWVLPDWNSGTGPGDWGRLIDVGAYSTNSSSSWWSLYLSPDGSTLNFSSETNGIFTNYLSCPISWDTNTWHLVDLTFAFFRSQLFIDGQLVTNGSGSFYIPSAEVISNGFFVGSDDTGWQQSRALIDDLATYNYDLSEYEVSNDYAAGLQIMNGGGFSPDDGPPGPGGGGGGSGGGGSGGSYTPPDYGTNLWIQAFEISSNNFTGILSNTVADVEYQLLSMDSLYCTQWTPQGFVLGPETTNYTPWSIPYSATNNFFLRAVSWEDASGSGVPDWWWLKYFGEDTNVDGNAPDPAGDGWTDYQKFAMGISPSVWVTPPAPSGFSLFYNSINGTVTLTWQPSLGSVTGYTLTQFDPITDTLITHTTAATTFVDTSPVTNFIPEYGWPSYTLRASYTNGNSAYASLSIFDPGTTVSAQIVAGTGSNENVAITSPIPPGTAALQFIRSYFDFGPDDYTVNTYDIPISDLNDDSVQLAANLFQINNSDYLTEDWYVQTINTNGAVSEPSPVFSESENNDNQYPPPFIDGRQQLEQNISFLLRAANTQLTIENPMGVNWGFTYAYSGLYDETITYSGESFGPYLDKFEPFEENYLYKNCAYSTNDLDTNGFLTTGLIENPSGYGLVPPVTYSFQPETSNSVISAVLDPADTQFITFYPRTESDYEIEFGGYVAGYEDGPAEFLGLEGSGGAWTFSNPVTNYYGLPITSVLFTYNTQDNAYDISLLSLGDSNTNISTGGLYWHVTPPELQTVGYYFAQPWVEPLPGDPNFSDTNVTSTGLVAGFGQTSVFAGYAEQILLNGIVNTNAPYAYLGQYFEPQAYQVDTNGNITTNSAGIVSPYGEFVGTEPGPVAMITMPNYSEDVQGTGVVQVVKLVLDVNHDGIMDLTAFGPDNTTTNTPYVFWVNNNFDRWHVVDLSDSEQDDLQTAAQPDCNYTDGFGNRIIPCQRDLEDYARLWVCGITSNVLATLPPGCTISLNWGDVGYPNSGNPTIDLFTAADTDGGIGYQTNETVATEQTNSTDCPYIGRIGPGSNLVLNASMFANNWAGNYFIWCGVSNGTGGLNLTIANSNGTVLAQTTTYIQIVDIKQMYERWTVGDNPNLAPATKAVLATDGLAAGELAFRYPLSADTNTPYILHVHGWNMPTWEKDRYAESEFKRLYWQGYQGRFGEFRWPTYYNFPLEAFESQAFDLDNYNESEFNAWESGTGLLNLLTNLAAEYPGQVYLTAHSMGNMVAGEALRLAGTNQVVNTYVAMQGALASQTYYAYATPRTIPPLLDHGTPNCYANYWTNGAPCYFNGSAGAGTYVNFFNTNDYALNANNWQLNQNLKPSSGYGYSSDPAIGFFEGEYTNIILHFPTNTYQIFSFGDPARCYALGAQPDIAGVFLVLTNYNQVELDIPPYNFGATHKYHSGEFRSDNAQRGIFWNQVLIEMGIKTNL